MNALFGLYGMIWTQLVVEVLMLPVSLGMYAHTFRRLRSAPRTTPLRPRRESTEKAAQLRLAGTKKLCYTLSQEDVEKTGRNLMRKNKKQTLLPKFCGGGGYFFYKS